MRKISLLVILVLNFSSAQETLREIRQQIKSVEAEADREKSLHNQELKNNQAHQKVFQEKQASFQQQSKSLQMQIDSLQQELKVLEEERQKEQKLVHWFGNRRQRYANNLAKTIDSIAPLMRKDFPVQNIEAAEALSDVSEQLRNKIIGPEEALGRVFDLLIDRTQMGYSTENWTGFLSVGGRSIPGKYVRYGAVSALFISQDGHEVYYLDKKAGEYAWHSVGENLEMRQWFKDALKVSEGKAPPSLVILPFGGISMGGANE